MKHLLILILILTTMQKTMCQEHRVLQKPNVNGFIDSLKKQGISKYGLWHIDCIGCNPVAYPWKRSRKAFCRDEYPIYLFWQKGQKAYIKKLGVCGASNNIETDAKSLFDYPDKYSDLMKKENLREFSNRMRTYNDSVIIRYGYSDSPYTHLLFVNDGDSMVQSIDPYSCLKETEDGTRNFNYEYNSKLRFVQWNEQLTVIINDLEKRKKFKQARK